MTDCPNGEIRDMLPDLLHDRLDATTRASVEQHLASCDDCRAELALLRDLRSTIRRAPAVDAAAIAAAIPAYRAPARQRSWTGWRAAAAIAAITVGGTSIALISRQQATSHTAEVAISTAPSAPNVTSPARPESSASTAPAPTPDRTQSASPAPTASATEHVSLAMTGGAVGELTDRELATLLDDIESLDALPSEEVDGGAALDPSLSLEQSR